VTVQEVVPWASIVSPLIAAVALYLAWRVQRENQLRRGEVLGWANRAIDVLQTLALLMRRKADNDESIIQLAVQASVLIEQGRMFFRNKPHSYGAEKLPAYQGIRPLILDKLVIACGTAWAWPTASVEERRRLAYVLAQAEKWFVSLAQMEVGRSRSASVDASQAGNGVRIQRLLAEVDEEALMEWERSTASMSVR